MRKLSGTEQLLHGGSVNKKKLVTIILVVVDCLDFLVSWLKRRKKKNNWPAGWLFFTQRSHFRTTEQDCITEYHRVSLPFVIQLPLFFNDLKPNITVSPILAMTEIMNGDTYLTQCSFPLPNADCSQNHNKRLSLSDIFIYHGLSRIITEALTHNMLIKKDIRQFITLSRFLASPEIMKNIFEFLQIYKKTW